jgi:CDGSH-type Zn-finger protein
MTLAARPGAVIVQCVEGGPLIVRGPHVVKDAKGAVVESGQYTALCRCTRSKSLPVCDGSHAAPR